MFILLCSCYYHNVTILPLNCGHAPQLGTAQWAGCSRETVRRRLGPSVMAALCMVMEWEVAGLPYTYIQFPLSTAGVRHCEAITLDTPDCLSCSTMQRADWKNLVPKNSGYFITTPFIFCVLRKSVLFATLIKHPETSDPDI